MSEYSQSFYAYGGKGKFHGVDIKHPYLSPLEIPDNKEPKEIEPAIGGKMNIYLKVNRTALELDSQIAVLRSKIHKLESLFLKFKGLYTKRISPKVYKGIDIKETNNV